MVFFADVEVFILIIKGGIFFFFKLSLSLHLARFSDGIQRSARSSPLCVLISGLLGGMTATQHDFLTVRYVMD